MQLGSAMKSEHEILLKEKKHILNEEVQHFFEEVQVIFSFLPDLFTAKPENGNCKITSEKYMLTNSNVPNSAKCFVSLVGNCILEADLAIYLSKSVLYQSKIYETKPWRLQQLQDSYNQIKCALFLLNTWDHEADHSSDKLINFLDTLMYHIKLSKDHLLLPRKKTLEELVKNPYKKCFNPALPNDVVVSFYIQGHKLNLSVYQLCTTNNGKVDILSKHTCDSDVPWINDVLLMLFNALHKCQVLKSKMTKVKSLMF